MPPTQLLSIKSNLDHKAGSSLPFIPRKEEAGDADPVKQRPVPKDPRSTPSDYPQTLLEKRMQARAMKKKQRQTYKIKMGDRRAA